MKPPCVALVSGVIDMRFLMTVFETIFPGIDAESSADSIDWRRCRSHSERQYVTAEARVPDRRSRHDGRHDRVCLLGGHQPATAVPGVLCAQRRRRVAGRGNRAAERTLRGDCGTWPAGNGARAGAGHDRLSRSGLEQVTEDGPAAWRDALSRQGGTRRL